MRISPVRHYCHRVVIFDMGPKLIFSHYLHSIEPQSDKPDTDTFLLDGAAVLNMLNPGVSRTFHEYAYQVFVPHVTCQLESARRADIILDWYFQVGVKATAMSLRGQGDSRKVKANTPVPGNWKAFLRCDVNKAELFNFLAD